MPDDTHTEQPLAELRISYRYLKEHPWVVQAVTGFLSAYFMEYPGFRVRRHMDELESGMHVWLCEVPPPMTMPTLLRRLRADLPPCRIVQPRTDDPRPHYLVDSPEPA